VPKADEAERDLRRRDLNEPYRTLPGHFRHETGHHYWERLVRNGLRIERRAGREPVMSMDIDFDSHR